MPVFTLADANTCVPQTGPQEVVVITTSDVEAVQGALEIVQRNVAVPGTAKPVTPDVGELGVVIVAVPETTDHAPVPTVAVLPANVAVLAPQAGFIAEPELAVVGVALTVTETVLTGVAEAQVLLSVSVYIPAPAVVIPAMVGLCNVEAKLLGPVQFQLVAFVAAPVKVNVLPAQMGVGLADAVTAVGTMQPIQPNATQVEVPAL